MGIIQHPSASVAPPAAITRVLARFDRAELAGFIEVAIGLLDVAEGDPDMEDSETASPLVDAKGRYRGWVAASDDEDREPDDDGLDVAWIERDDQTKPGRELPAGDAGKRWNSCIAGEDDDGDG